MALESFVVPNEHYLFGMTTMFEQEHYETLAREMDGAGEVVDLGCWLGSTTISLARGLTKNPNLPASQRKIYAYDRFQWEPYMREIVQGTPLEKQFTVGGSFLKEYKKRIAPWSKRVVVCKGDLLKEKWNGTPIEILLVDAMKSPELANRIWQQFYSALVPGKSVVVHQDFGHFSVWWIHLLQYRLREYFSVFHEVRQSSTVTFRLEKAIPPHRFGTLWDFDTVPNAEINAAFGYWMEQIHEPTIRDHLAASHVIAFIEHGQRRRSEEVSANYVRRGFSLMGHRAFERTRLEQDNVLRAPRTFTPAFVSRNKLPDALKRGLEFVSAQQADHGQFPLAPLEQDNQPPLYFHGAPFATMHILHALEDVAGAGALIEAGLDYLQTQRVEGGLWRMWGYVDPTQESDAHYQIPADVDSTALVSLLLRRHNRPVPDNKRRLLKFRNARNVFKTWSTPDVSALFVPAYWRQVLLRKDPNRISRFWKQSGAHPQETDVVVNAHALVYLGVQRETRTVLDWMNWAVLNLQDWSENRLYRDIFVFYDALAQNINAGIIHLNPVRNQITERLEAFAKPDGRIGDNVLQTALALNTLRNLGSASPALEPALEYLLQTQTAEGGWRAVPLLWTRRSALPWGSEALTTAFCLRVLAYYQEEG